MTTSGIARRSPDAQMKAMSADWPDFKGRKLPDGTLVWAGPLMPKARVYSVSILWNPGMMSLPYVMVNEPALEPGPEGSFAAIPHLIFYAEKPERSGLCLFDPHKFLGFTPGILVLSTQIHSTSKMRSLADALAAFLQNKIFRSLTSYQ